MDNISQLFCFPVLGWGSAAARLHSNSWEGKVSALFNSSFYVQSSQGFICIGNQSLTPAPLNVMTSAPDSTDWSASGLRLNDPTWYSNGILKVGSRFTFSVTGADLWRPDPLPAEWNIEQLQQNLTSFRRAAQQQHIPDGLAPAININTVSVSENQVCKAAEQPIEELQTWLRQAFSNSGEATVFNPDIIKPLIGLGPGLTPSGDDFIAGVMITLHALDCSHICEPLWYSVRRCAPPLTNPISFAHLECAAEGQASSALHQALHALFGGHPEDIQNCLSGINDIGHTSGWDCMAGIVITLESYLQGCSTAPVHLQDHGN